MSCVAFTSNSIFIHSTFTVVRKEGCYLLMGRGVSRRVSRRVSRGVSKGVSKGVSHCKQHRQAHSGGGPGDQF